MPGILWTVTLAVVSVADICGGIRNLYYGDLDRSTHGTAETYRMDLILAGIHDAKASIQKEWAAGSPTGDLRKPTPSRQDYTGC